MDYWWIWGLLVAIFDFIMAVGVTVHAVLNKREIRAVIGWVGLAWLAPIIGSLAYWLLGVNRIQRKTSSLNIRQSWKEPIPEISQSEMDRIEHYSGTRPNILSLATAGGRLTGNRLLPGNAVHPLVDGDEAYPAMMDAIDQAEQSISLLSYIFDSDRVGEKFLQALLRAKKRGVEVRVLIDSVGSNYSKPTMIRRLEDAGIPVAGFLPTRIPRLLKYANMRNHRKILVTDGRVGFTGGTNIREGHWLDLDPVYPVQCLHFQLNGPVVAHMQQMFATDWAFSTGEKIKGSKWFPEPTREGDVWARGIEHGPDEKFENLSNLIASALATAQYRVRIFTPYFLPNDALIQALNVTALRGVEVEIFVPSHNNIPFVHWACTAQMPQMMEKGCHFYYTPPPFDHTKLMIVDDFWSLIGSTNWDPRSLRLNFEFNVECYSQDLIRQLDELADRKAMAAQEVTLKEIVDRPFPIRLRDGLARLLSPYL